MIFYQLNITPDDSAGEGEDHDEYFTSLTKAKARRSEIMRQGEVEPYDLEIEKITLTDQLSTKDIILAILNGRGYIATRESVVAPYQRDRRSDNNPNLHRVGDSDDPASTQPGSRNLTVTDVSVPEWIKDEE